MKNVGNEKHKLLHLQGVRGIAVLAVVFFHFFPDLFPNGYLGVDQFFVLSGYLMAMMMSRASSSISDFLYRRVKRILPLYLIVVLLVTLTLSAMPSASLKINLKSAKTAVFLISNIVTSDNSYFEKLGVAVDMYTHTWSLSLEMQFYIVFPVIYLFYQRSGKNGMFAVGLASLAMYSMLCPETRFNSMFCRIWQFLVEQSDMVHEEENVVETNLSLTILFYLLFSREKHSSDFARIVSTLLTGIIIHVGQKSIFLENDIVVYTGEVSYVWYLIHWPVYAAVKMNNLTEYLPIALLLSLFASAIVHIVVEKQILKLNLFSTASLIFILYFISIVLVFVVYKAKEFKYVSEQSHDLQRNFTLPTNVSVFSPMYADQIPISKQYSHITKSMVLKFNEANDINEMNQISAEGCGRIKEDMEDKQHCIRKSNGTKYVMVIGNSYAANAEPIIWDECREYVSVLERITLPVCEPLLNQGNLPKFRCASIREWLFKMVKERKPDYLIIAERAFQMMQIDEGTGPFDGKTFKEAVSRLQTLQKFVKKKIYLLDAMPEFRTQFVRELDNHFTSSTPFNESATIRIDERILIGRLRMQRLAKICSICELYDYTPRFFIGGKFRFHDPQTGVRFMAQGHHLTPPGLERVRGLYTQICQQIRIS